MLIKAEGTFEIGPDTLLKVLEDETSKPNLLELLNIFTVLSKKIDLNDLNEFERNFSIAWSLNQDWLIHFREIVIILKEQNGQP